MKHVNEYAKDLHTIYVVGLLAIGLTLFQDFLGLDHPDFWMQVSVVSYAAAFPLLAGAGIVMQVEQQFKHGPDDLKVLRRVEHTFHVGLFLAIVAIAAACWHFSWLAGVAFVGALVVALWVYTSYVNKLEKHDNS